MSCMAEVRAWLAPVVCPQGHEGHEHLHTPGGLAHEMGGRGMKGRGLGHDDRGGGGVLRVPGEWAYKLVAAGRRLGVLGC